MAKRKNKPEPSIVIQGNMDTPYYKVGEWANIIHPVHAWMMKKVCINSFSLGEFKLNSGEHYLGFAYNVSAMGAIEEMIVIPEIYLRKDYEAGDWYELGTSTGWGENIIDDNSI